MATIPTLQIIGVGGWGREVAKQVSAFVPEASVTLVGKPFAFTAEPHLLRDAGSYLLAAGAPAPVLASLLDRAAFASGVPWLPVIVEHPFLRVGPTVVPGAGPCFGCWRRRLRQHAIAPDLEFALEQEYRQARSPSPAGYLPAAARLASAVALDVLSRLPVTANLEAGRVRQMDLLTRRLTTGQVAGVHGCPRCGLGTDERRRSSAGLLDELSEVLS